MKRDLEKELKNSDPQERARIIKEIALSGNQENLQFLKEVVENDPDPRIQEYARKAARHLYSSENTSSTEGSSPPPGTVSPEEGKTLESSSEGNRISSPSDIQAAEQKVQRAFNMHTAGQTKKALQVFSQALEMNPDLEKDTFTRGVAADLTGKTPDEALRILKKPDGWKEFIEGTKPKSTKPDLTPNLLAPSSEVDQIKESGSQSKLIKTWLSFFKMTEDFLAEEQGKANQEDTFLSILVFTIASVLIFLVNGFFQFQQITQLMGDQLSSLELNLGMVFFFLLLGTVILTPLSFYISVGLQFLGVRLFGGKGKFKSHVYLLALIQVPLTIMGGVVSLAAFIPIIGFVAGLVGLVLSIYGIILTVRAVKVVHNVSTGQAIGGIIVPPLILMFIGGCIMMALGSTLAGLLGQIQ
ncbi:MAG: YIP1 family protein [Anaerolineales bacterium]|nr:YIP1 family protein [Anaerolineales bacterium]